MALLGKPGPKGDADRLEKKECRCLQRVLPLSYGSRRTQILPQEEEGQPQGGLGASREGWSSGEGVRSEGNIFGRRLPV